MPAAFLHLVEDSPECPICLDVLDDTPTRHTVTTACGHTFHASCLWAWVDTSARKGFVPLCPSCNVDVTLHADDVEQMHAQVAENTRHTDAKRVKPRWTLRWCCWC